MQSGRPFVPNKMEKLLLLSVACITVASFQASLAHLPRTQAASHYLMRPAQRATDWSPRPASSRTDGTSWDSVLTITHSSYKARFPVDITFTLDATDRFAAITSATLFTRVQGSDAVSQVSQTIAKSARDIHLTYLWDTQQKYIVPGSRITFWWELRDAVGNTLSSDRQSFNDDDNRFAWKQLTQGLITVYWYNGDGAFGQALLSDAVKSIQRIGASFGGVSPKAQIKVWNYGSIDDLHSALAPGSYEWVGGQAQPQLNEVLLAIPPGDDMEIRRSLPHELDHVLFYQITENPFSPPPPWLDEGLAVYNQDYHPASLTDRFEKAVQDGSLIPLQQLNSSFPVDPDQAYLSYGESWCIVQYIFAHYGKGRMAALISAFNAGVTPDQAVQKAFGISLAQLDSDWHVSLHLPPTIDSSGQGRTSGTGLAHPAPEQASAPNYLPIGAGIVAVLLVLGGGALAWTARRTQNKR